MDFFTTSSFLNGCNSSFITLIPKTDNSLLVSNYRPISLIGIQYKIVSKILANRLSLIVDSVVSREQSAFIKGRQILDGPLILNEIVDWYRTKKKKLMLFKIDFAKAYDSVSWKYLMAILQAMGFGDKWIGGINSCLRSALSSILINGSPTAEFSIIRGLRQGDPLAPFLFILAMEGLHIAIEKLVVAGRFRGAQVSNVNISHLMYADDVILMGEWSDANLNIIRDALKFFYYVSGLNINFQKSSLFGIGEER